MRFELDETPPTELGCHFEVPFFGAHYPDGTCIDGYMWDLDSCDEPGGPLSSGGEVPCPNCNRSEYVEYGRESAIGDGFDAFFKGVPVTKRPEYWDPSGALRRAWLLGWVQGEMDDDYG